MLGPADLPVAAGHPLRAAMAERVGPLAFAVMGSELVDTMISDEGEPLRCPRRTDNLNLSELGIA
jgi:hypothetical protein